MTDTVWLHDRNRIAFHAEPQSNVFRSASPRTPRETVLVSAYAGFAAVHTGTCHSA